MLWKTVALYALQSMALAKDNTDGYGSVRHAVGNPYRCHTIEAVLLGVSKHG